MNTLWIIIILGAMVIAAGEFTIRSIESLAARGRFGAAAKRRALALRQARQ